MVKFVSNKIMKFFSFKKIVAVGLSCVMFFQCSSLSFASEMKNSAEERYNDKIENLVGKPLSIEEISKIKSEMSVLKKYNIYISMIDKIYFSSEGNKYIVGDEKVTVNKDNSSITVVGENGIKNVASFSENGNLIVDGFEIQSNVVDIDNNGYKSTKSLYPYGKLKPSDYNNYLTSGQQDLVLGKAIENITYIVFHDILLKYTGFKDIIDSIVDIARNIRLVLVGEDPKTEHVGCKFTTYTAGTDDYKYINKFYANKDCTGTYDEELSYEHFIVY